MQREQFEIALLQALSSKTALRARLRFEKSQCHTTPPGSTPSTLQTKNMHAKLFFPLDCV